METAFSRRHGFSNTYSWWAATMSESKQSKNWLFILYLASSYFTLDPRDVLYGLRGLMKFSNGSERLLEPDYNKSMFGVYRDAVEAAFVNFETTDVLLYNTGDEDPSWVPRWDKPMLLRNPIRFGKSIPWKPGGETKPIWNIDKESNVLSLHGFAVGHLQFVEVYNQSFFGNAMVGSDEGRNKLKHFWGMFLQRMTESNQYRIPLSAGSVAAIAASFSFGLDEKSKPSDEYHLLRNFVAYLGMVLDKEIYDAFIPPDVVEMSQHADGRDFGKPVWDFQYPESSFFIIEGGLVGCSISITKPEDVVFVGLGSTYPLILRPDGGGYFRIGGYAYVHGIMNGEFWNKRAWEFEIR